MRRIPLATRVMQLEAHHPPGKIHVVYPHDGETVEAAVQRLELLIGPHDHVIAVVYEDTPDALDL